MGREKKNHTAKAYFTKRRFWDLKYLFEVTKIVLNSSLNFSYTKPLGTIVLLACVFYLCIPQLRGDTYLIDSIKISDWTIREKPYEFDPQNLYEYMNGGADSFIANGFVSLQGARYYSKSNPNDSITIDIYDMGEKLNAFGMFQLKRGEQAASLKIGTASFETNGYLTFYKNKYFIEILSFVKSKTKKIQHRAIAYNVAEKIKGDTSSPWQLSLLPQFGRVKGSERYVKGEFLNDRFFNRTIVSKYMLEGEKFSVFLSFFPSREDAIKTFEQYKNSLNTTGRCPSMDNLGEHCFISHDPMHKKILIVQKGSYITGVYDLSMIQKGIRILEDIIKEI
ncbi:MAG: DUF6599 family protein [Thermodesulfobacteriota bacterium]|nr:DUF6599 family protein [Thermodesulfobacteriota bacterium]